MSHTTSTSHKLVAALPKRALTSACGVLAALPLPRAGRAPLYRAFASAVGADLSEVADPLDQFETFNAFFARPLRDGLRPWTTAADAIGSPADGRLDASGRVAQGRMLQAKGIDYAACDLVAGALTDEELDSAAYATVYLSPRDYHRVHVPIEGVIRSVTHVGGEIWPVNGTSVPFVDRLFCRNERLVARLEAPDGNAAAVVMVGATVVGKMTCEHPDVAMLEARDRGSLRTDVAWRVDAGDLFGSFLLGSTVIVVVQDRQRAWRASNVPGSPIRVGEPLFQAN